LLCETLALVPIDRGPETAADPPLCDLDDERPEDDAALGSLKIDTGTPVTTWAGIWIGSIYLNLRALKINSQSAFI